jgi:protein tyrosine phosphatase
MSAGASGDATDYDEWVSDDPFGPGDRGEPSQPPPQAAQAEARRALSRLLATARARAGSGLFFADAARTSAARRALGEAAADLRRRIERLERSTGGGHRRRAPDDACAGQGRRPASTGFESEFAAVRARCEGAPGFASLLAPQTPATMAKNRYHNVLPLAATRVRLPPRTPSGPRRGPPRGNLSICRAPDADYINANLVGGADGDDAYIATQAPLPETLGDFWRMVWSSGAGAVLMLTGLVEGGAAAGNPDPEAGRAAPHAAPRASSDPAPQGVEAGAGTLYGPSQVPSAGRVKAVQYWPDDGFRASFDGVAVETTAELLQDGFALRALRLVDEATGDARRCVHLEYSAWPDFGAVAAARLRTVAVLAEASRLLREGVATGAPSTGAARAGEGGLPRAGGHSRGGWAEGKPGAPVVVHCSAGVGRTGTFVAIDVLARRLRRALTGSEARTGGGPPAPARAEGDGRGRRRRGPPAAASRHGDDGGAVRNDLQVHGGRGGGVPCRGQHRCAPLGYDAHAY